MRIASNRAEELLGAMMSIDIDHDEWCMLVHDVVEAWAWSLDETEAVAALGRSLEQMPETSLVRQGAAIETLERADDPDLVYEILCEAMGFLLEQALIDDEDRGEALLSSLLVALDYDALAILHEYAMHAYLYAFTSVEAPVDQWLVDEGHLNLALVGLDEPCPWRPSCN